MKLMGDMLLRQAPFSEIVMGNTAVVRAMVEAGTRVVTSYPGSPTPERSPSESPNSGGNTIYPSAGSAICSSSWYTT